jgi:hypothetical protein
MGSGGLGDLDLSELQQYLGRTEFPADKQEVASNAESTTKLRRPWWLG